MFHPHICHCQSQMMNFVVLLLLSLFAHIYALSHQGQPINIHQVSQFTTLGTIDPSTGIYTPDASEIPDPSHEGNDYYGLNVTTATVPLRLIQNYWKGSPTCEKNIRMRSMQYDARPGCHKVCNYYV